MKEIPGQFKIEFPSGGGNDDDNPAYYEAYWRKELADKRREEQKKEEGHTSNKKETKEDNNEKKIEERLKEIGEILGKMRAIFENRVKRCAGLQNENDASNFPLIKKTIQRLEFNNQKEDSYELSRSMGGLKIIITAQKKFNKNGLDDFIKYFEEIKSKKGVSCPDILSLVQYGELQKILKEIKA